MTRWFVGTNTKQAMGPAFKTKREAVAYGMQHIAGVFFVWKGPIVRWYPGLGTLHGGVK